MIIVGIDPGMTGAIAWFSKGKLSEVFDMPTYDGRVDGLELAGHFFEREVDVVYLENTHPMPKNGSIASYKLGLNTGIVIGVVQACTIPLVRISVSAWRNFNGLRSKDKSASRGLARELWPEHAELFRLAKSHNRAEAALIGRYGVYRQIHDTQTGEEQDESGIASVSDLRGKDHHPSGLHPRRVDRPAHRAVTSTTEE